MRSRHPQKTFLIVGNKPDASKYLAGEQGFMEEFKTIFACGADEALLIASKSPKIDMLLTDLLLENNYWMPEINGVEFAQEFSRKYPNTKILFMIP